MDLLIDVVVDALVDTAKLIPFLFVTYLAMEALEHGAAGMSEQVVAKAGKTGPIVGALLGAIPQCGFSAMAATLFSARVVTLGTLMAVFLSTSDEMLPVFIANQAPLPTIVSILATKVVVGMVAGLAIDTVLRALHRLGDGHAHIHELCDRAHCHCDEECEPETSADASCACHDHGHAESHGAHGRVWGIVRSALVHTLQVSAFILAITLVLNLLIELVGIDELASLIGTHPVRATLIAALVGLIPNCGASVVISQLYLEGALGAGAMMAGLLVSAGVGLLVLFRTNNSARENLFVVALLYVIGVACGLAVGVLGVTF